ncbi:hypothetical protein [Bordetella ansorpii]|uniref:hypothetical protein n=1 Tax=Bordetella ansorpii TaxID=288768 RepID=UPI000AB06FA5
MEQHPRRFAYQQLAVGEDAVGFGIDFDTRLPVIDHHICLAAFAYAEHRSLRRGY